MAYSAEKKKKKKILQMSSGVKICFHYLNN